MSAIIRIDVAGMAGTTLDALKARLGDLGPLLDSIGMGLVASTTQRFEDEQGPNGAYWLPSRQAAEKGSKTLTGETQTLRDSISHRVHGNTLQVGSDTIYAPIHQFGGWIMPKSAKHLHFKTGTGWVKTTTVNIPARPFLGVDHDDEAMIESEVEYFVMGATQ